MKTENLVFANLQKLKNKKQNFGAISDAINEGKTLFYEEASELNNYDIEVTDMINSIYNTIQNLQPQLESLLQEKGKYLTLYSKLEEEANELNNFGIEVGSEWQRVKDSFGYTMDLSMEFLNELKTFNQ